MKGTTASEMMDSLGDWADSWVIALGEENIFRLGGLLCG